MEDRYRLLQSVLTTFLIDVATHFKMNYALKAPS